MLRTLEKPVSHMWSHAPTHYTREKMRQNVMKLQSHYFEKLIGRPLTEPEMKSQWSLYETLEWNPIYPADAVEQLKQIQKWLNTLANLPFIDKNIRRDVFSREAERSFYQLCSKATRLLGLRTMRFTRGMSIDKRAKIFAKSLLSGKAP
jgi:hypothetical protein